MWSGTIGRMIRNKSAIPRTRAIAKHMMSTDNATSANAERDPVVQFEQSGRMRRYLLNRPKKLNTLDNEMIELLRPQLEIWNRSEIAFNIVGTGAGKAFCAGGDVVDVVNKAKNPETREEAVGYFKNEFDLDYQLSRLKKPYIAILDGFTMGGGVGLSGPATFRIATEKTIFAFPETKIGYFPDVGASYYLSRMDGELGTFLSLTGLTLAGRSVFELGFATHYIPSTRIPALLEGLADMESNADESAINSFIEEFSSEREPTESPTPYTGEIRKAIDSAFKYDDAQDIFNHLSALRKDSNKDVADWAADILDTLKLRSPTSIKVALKAIREGRKCNDVGEALHMEMSIAAAFCREATKDFVKGVSFYLIDKSDKKKEGQTDDPPKAPNWLPASLGEVGPEIVARFFDPELGYISNVPRLHLPVDEGDSPEGRKADATRPSGKRSSRRKSFPGFALPSEKEIKDYITGEARESGNMGGTFDEVMAHFLLTTDKKMGVAEKVAEVISRKCRTVDNGDGNFVWLQWIH